MSLSSVKGDVGLRVRELIRQACEYLEIEILRGVISKDRVYLLIPVPPTFSQVEVVGRIKGRSSAKLFQEFSHLKKRSWGGIFG